LVRYFTFLQKTYFILSLPLLTPQRRPFPAMISFSFTSQVCKPTYYTTYLHSTSQVPGGI